MSPEELAFVRKPLSIRARSSRTLDERLALRFPRLTGRLVRMFSRLPPSSRVRQAGQWRGAGQAVEAFNRQDFEALSIVYHRQAEFHAPSELAESGIVLPNSHGYDAWCKAIVEWLAVWDEYRQEPSEMIDLGDRLVILDELVGHGTGSGVPLRQEHAVLYIRENGKVLHQYEFFSHAEALEAVGLRE